MSPTEQGLMPLAGGGPLKGQAWVEECFARHGLLRGPRRVGRKAPPAPGPEQFAYRLRAALEELGPVFAGFGRYLSTRADLLRPEDCLVLGAIPDRVPAAELSVILRQVETELGRPANQLFASFTRDPVESRLVDQAHRASLPDGTQVVVCVVRSAEEGRWERELELLPVLKRVFPSPGLPLDETIADFKRGFSTQLDCHRQAEDLETLARETRGSELIAVSRVFREWTSARVLTVEWMDGGDLEAYALEQAGPADEAKRRRVIQRFSLIWLQLALASRAFPIEARAAELGDGRIAITGGTFAGLPSASRGNLWNYVRATAAHQPERAGKYLYRELSDRARTATERELCLRLRQAVPFRDGGWTDTSDTIAEHLLLHWRIARECGFDIPPHLVQFYRGLFRVARLGQRLDPSGDPVSEGLEGLDWLAGWTQLRHQAAFRNLQQPLFQFALTALDLPQKLDRLLDLAARGAAQRPAARRRPWSAATAVVSISLLMGALALLAGQASLLQHEWGERIGAVVFLLLGALLLRAAWKMR